MIIHDQFLVGKKWNITFLAIGIENVLFPEERRDSPSSHQHNDRLLQYIDSKAEWLTASGTILQDIVRPQQDRSRKEHPAS